MKSRTNTTLQSLEREANALPSEEVAFRVPLHVLLGEAVDVARFCKRHWDAERAPKTDVVLRPGLELAGEEHLPAAIVDEILVLQREVQHTQTAYLLAVDPPRVDATYQRAVLVRDEIAATLEWLFDDGRHDERDVQLAAVVEAHRDDPDSEDALAGELMDYAGLASRHRDEMDGLGNFDVAMIDEAPDLAAALRERSAASVGLGAMQAARLLERRNRLAALLQQRMARARKAARFVFRGDPQIVRLVTSTYERRQRAARRRAAASAETEVRPAAANAPAGSETA